MKFNNKGSWIILILVCLGPLLNLLFDRFALHQKPAPIVWISTVLSLAVLLIYTIVYIKFLK